MGGLTRSPAPCHTTADGFGVTTGRLNMETQAKAYAALVNVPAAGSACAGHGTLVVPGSPSSSLMYLKVSLTDASPCGVKMPDALAPLTQDQVTQVSDWILAGAQNN